MAPAYQITAIDAPLEPGNTYAWRVQAYDEDELGLIKNNGWSEPRLFIFGEACIACQQFAIANTTHSRAELEWQGAFEHTSWEVRYRRKADKNEDELPWKTKEFLTDQGIVKPLEDSTYYQFQVRGSCAGGRFGEWSAVKEAITEKAPESTYSCEGGVVTIAWENNDPLLTPMEVGEKFTAGDFDVTVVEDVVANGQHTGIGMIRIAAFNKVFFNVEWEDITLNTDNQLIDGEALVTGSDTDIIPPELAAAIMGGLDVLDKVLAGAEFVANVIDNLPTDIKQDYTSSKSEVDTSKEQLKEEKKLLKEAKKHLKNLDEEDEGYEEAVAAVEAMETTVESRRQTVATAQGKKSQAIKKAINYVTAELQKGIKYFVKFTTGVVDVLNDKSGAIRSGKAQQVVADGDTLLAYIAKIDGDTLPPSAASSLVRQQEEEALLAIVDQMVSVIEIIQGGSDANVENIISTTQNIINSKDQLAEASTILGRFSGGGIPEAVDMAKTSVWAFKMIFEKMYNATANDEGEVQDGSNWATEDLIIFTKNESTPYGFDTGGRTADKSYYTEINFGGDTENYILPWVVAEGTNTVEVAINGATENVFFRSEDKSLTANARDGVVSLQSKKDNKPTEWQAYKTINGKEKYVGKINVQPYEKQQYTLRIYAVNGQTLPDATALQMYLNSVYGQALIEWTVDIKDSYDLKYSAWDINPQDDALQVGDSESLTAYTSEQKNIIKYFRDKHTKPKGKEVVLFWSPKASDEGVNGFMPLSSRYGFIFNPSNNVETYRTVAHELGHGAFGLGHTWKTLEGITKGSTANLMDYNGGLELWKWQWEILQNPAAMVSFVNEDQEGMAYNQNGSSVAILCDKNVIAEVVKQTIFYTPDGTAIDLSLYKDSKLRPYSIYTNDDVTTSARGAVHSLIDESGKVYTLRFLSQSLTNRRYKSSDGKEVVIESIKTTSTGFRVSIDCATKNVTINGTTIQSSCLTCKEIEADVNESTFFKDYGETKVDHLISYAKSIGKSVEEKLNERAEIIDALKEKLNTDANNSNLLGERMVDRLNAYETLNDKQFKVVFLETNFLSTNQKSWNDLAKVVFEQKGYTKNDILVTIPFVNLKGIGNDMGEMYAMPGIYAGSNVNIKTSNLKADYANSIATSEWLIKELDKEHGILVDFIFDLFKNTEKRVIIYEGILNPSLSVNVTKYQGQGFYGQNHYVKLYQNEATQLMMNQVDQYKIDIDKLKAPSPNQKVRQELLLLVPKLIRNARKSIVMNIKGSNSKQLLQFTPEKTEEYLFKDTYAVQFSKNEAIEDQIIKYIKDQAFNKYVARLNTLEITVHFDAYSIDKTSNTWNREQIYWETIDQYAYTSFDILSMGLSLIALDFVADGMGLVYAVGRQDLEKTVEYTISLSIPLMNGEMIKVTKESLLYISRKGGTKQVSTYGFEKAFYEVNQDITDGKAQEVITLIEQNKVTKELQQELTKYTDNANEQRKVIDKILTTVDTDILARLKSKFKDHEEITTWLNNKGDALPIDLLNKLEALPNDTNLLSKLSSDLGNIQASIEESPTMLDVWKTFVEMFPEEKLCTTLPTQ